MPLLAQVDSAAFEEEEPADEEDANATITEPAKPKTGEETKVQEENFISDLKKKSPAYRVLGREFTPQERAANGGNLTFEQVKNNYLHKELHLSVIRAAITVGEAKYASEILKVYGNTKAKPYEEVVKDFVQYREKYGSVLKGVQSETNLKLSEEQIFEETALKAYKAVFGVDTDELTAQEKQDIYTFLKGKEALTYTKMIEVFVKTMTQDEKKNILFGLLKEIKRDDLIKNKKFVDKILEQDFTHENLKKLLQELKK